ncbi:MAG: 2-phosphoglycerate kinase [Defluviitaleaceae bacterium]|nr:2-phosphoglycerate kinase [Defluviitaleaceae bacterium]
MVILIGGVSHTGKTYMAQQLLEKYKYPYLSIDHLKMGLYRANTGCGFTPCDDDEIIGEKLWGLLKGIIMTSIENNQNLIIEGCYLFPQNINEIETEYQRNIICFYLGLSKTYIEKCFQSEILRHRSVIEARGYETDFNLDDYILQNIKQKELCRKYNAEYFEIDKNYQNEIDKVYAWIDNEINLYRRRS